MSSCYFFSQHLGSSPLLSAVYWIRAWLGGKEWMLLQTCQLKKTKPQTNKTTTTKPHKRPSRKQCLDLTVIQFGQIVVWLVGQSFCSSKVAVKNIRNRSCNCFLSSPLPSPSVYLLFVFKQGGFHNSSSRPISTNFISFAQKDTYHCLQCNTTACQTGWFPLKVNKYPRYPLV